MEMASFRDGLHYDARVSRCTAGQLVGPLSGVGVKLIAGIGCKTCPCAMSAVRPTSGSALI